VHGFWFDDSGCLKYSLVVSVYASILLLYRPPLEPDIHLVNNRIFVVGFWLLDQLEFVNICVLLNTIREKEPYTSPHQED